MANQGRRQRFSKGVRVSWYILAPAILLLVLFAGAFLYLLPPANTGSLSAGSAANRQQTDPAPQAKDRRTSKSGGDAARSHSPSFPTRLASNPLPSGDGLAAAVRKGGQAAAAAGRAAELVVPLEETELSGQDGLGYGINSEEQFRGVPPENIGRMEEGVGQARKSATRVVAESAGGEVETVLANERLTPDGAVYDGAPIIDPDPESGMQVEEDSR